MKFQNIMMFNYVWVAGKFPGTFPFPVSQIPVRRVVIRSIFSFYDYLLSRANSRNSRGWSPPLLVCGSLRSCVAFLATSSQRSKFMRPRLSEFSKIAILHAGSFARFLEDREDSEPDEQTQRFVPEIWIAQRHWSPLWSTCTRCSLILYY